MKKICFAWVWIFFLQTFTACDREKAISETQLPQAARNFLNTHFPDVTVVSVFREWDEYDVCLSNGFQAGFDRKGEWDCVNGITQAVPQSIIALIPAAVPAYLSARFPDAIIVEINRETFGYDIELSNGLDLEFSLTGNIREIDD
ncbi:MAG: PepSY-like domain-containing protein [Bacteroidales bacterium]|nr:PepSY-like domain-containing protein [Bacteroidales bacterium]